MEAILLAIIALSCLVASTDALVPQNTLDRGAGGNRIANGFPLFAAEKIRFHDDFSATTPPPQQVGQRTSRRSVLVSSLKASGLLMALWSLPQHGEAAVGSLPEFADTNAILQGITINVADKSQQNAMIDFLKGAFEFSILRKRIRGTTEETWLGFGPEQVSIPKDWTPWLSSFETYGGHAAIHLVYDSKIMAPLYRIGDTSPPGDNVAYLQLGVPEYRVSQMVKNGGAVLDAYGFVTVISPAGLPIRAIVGISPDPMMFVAINCGSVEESRAFYERLGFLEQEYPYARVSKGLGQFEPPQPKNSIYMAPSKNCMGILLLPIERKKKVAPNLVVQSLNIVYSPSQDDEESARQDSRVFDPSGLPIRFQSVKDFEQEEIITR